jgi:hypothetical protein
MSNFDQLEATLYDREVWEYYKSLYREKNDPKLIDVAPVITIVSEDDKERTLCLTYYDCYRNILKEEYVTYNIEAY